LPSPWLAQDDNHFHLKRATKPHFMSVWFIPTEQA
jgi:hypothetical protein